MHKLKRMLLAEYGGFADKRIKKVETGRIFIVDDRSEHDQGRDGLPSWFCMMFADVISDNQIKLSLNGNVPRGTEVVKWLKREKLKIATGMQKHLQITVTPENYELLEELAEAIESIVAPGAPRYEAPSYKYVCPRTAESLRRLNGVLGKAWPAGEPIAKSGFGL